MRLVIDADVVIGALDQLDAHHSRARALFSGWHQGQDQVAISAVNLTEVLIAPSADAVKLAAARRAIVALGISVHRPDEAIAVEAAGQRQRHPVSLADGYCLATAKHGGSTLVSFDQKLLNAAQRERIALI